MKEIAFGFVTAMMVAAMVFGAVSFVRMIIPEDNEPTATHQSEQLFLTKDTLDAIVRSSVYVGDDIAAIDFGIVALARSGYKEIYVTIYGEDHKHRFSENDLVVQLVKEHYDTSGFETEIIDRFTYGYLRISCRNQPTSGSFSRSWQRSR